MQIQSTRCLVRKGVADDAVSIALLGSEFWALTEYAKDGLVYDVEKSRRVAAAMIDSGIVYVAEDNGIVGFIVMAVIEAPFSNGSMASELVFFVKEEYRGSGAGYELITCAMRDAEAIGCKHFNMAFIYSVTPEKAEGLFRKMGFKNTEATYTFKLS